jgi:hypothetical protein
MFGRTLITMHYKRKFLNNKLVKVQSIIHQRKIRQVLQLYQNQIKKYLMEILLNQLVKMCQTMKVKPNITYTIMLLMTVLMIWAHLKLAIVWWYSQYMKTKKITRENLILFKVLLLIAFYKSKFPFRYLTIKTKLKI